MNYQKVVKIDKVLTILNQRGLHARAAAKFTETIAAFSCEVTVSKNNETVSGSSIMGLLMLAARIVVRKRECRQQFQYNRSTVYP